MKNNEIKGLYL